MRVVQQSCETDSLAKNPGMAYACAAIAPPLIHNSRVEEPYETNFGRFATRALILHAKDVDTMVTGLTKHSSLMPTILEGTITAMFLAYDTGRSLNTNTFSKYLQTKVANLKNNAKAPIIKIKGKMEQRMNEKNGMPNRVHFVTKRFAGKIKFDPFLWHDDRQSYSDIKEDLRQNNMGDKHVTLILIPSHQRSLFEKRYKDITLIDGGKGSSLGAIAKHVRPLAKFQQKEMFARPRFNAMGMEKEINYDGTGTGYNEWNQDI